MRLYSTHVTVTQEAESLEQADERIFAALDGAGDFPWTWSWTTVEDLDDPGPDSTKEERDGDL